MGKWTAAACGTALVLAIATGAAKAQVAGSVESGLQTLAQDIVSKSAAADRDVIAVLPFPNADGSCSVLSTYLADELIQALFSVQGSPLKIVERSQLEALLREIQIGEGGLLNPETTQKLGSFSGVKALTVGTITEIGDRVRINARLVATDTGRTVSAAAVTVPRTSDLDGLLRRPIAGSGGVCGAAEGKAPARAGAAPPGPAPRPAAFPRADLAATVTLAGMTFTVQGLSRGPSDKQLSLVLSVLDTRPNPIRVLMLSPVPTLIDDRGGVAKTTEVTGLRNCELNGNAFKGNTWYCVHSSDRGEWTMLSPGQPTTVLLRFSPESELEGSTFSFASQLVVEDAEETGKNPRKPMPVSLSITNLTLGGAR